MAAMNINNSVDGTPGTEYSRQHLHAVLVPYPVQGQINPTLELGKRLTEQHGFVVTFVTNQYQFSWLQKSHQDFIDGSCGRFRLRWVDDGLPETFDYGNVNSDALTFHKANRRMMQEPLKQLILQQQQQPEDGVPPPTCVIVGTFCRSAQDTAKELGIPAVLFWTQSAAVCSIYLHSSKLIDNGFLPFKDHVDQSSADKGSSEHLPLVDCIPGIPPIEPHNLPTTLHIHDIFDPYFLFLKEQFENLHTYDGILINSYQELEDTTIMSLRSELQGIPILPVGPMLSYAFLGNQTGIPRDNDHTCLKWLDSKPEKSVLYISFGTIFTPSLEDFRKMAIGINASRKPFLWVIRENASKFLDSLPEGVVEEMKEIGLFISWAPQLCVLSHPSVGAFLSHCGWNSTLESLSLGVPVITYPLEMDQTTNSKLLVDEWKVGITIATQPRIRTYRTSQDVDNVDNKHPPTEQYLVHNAENVTKTVIALLQGEEQSSIRQRVEKLSLAAKNASRPGGSSYSHVQQFISKIIC